MYYKRKKFYFPRCYTIVVGYLSLSLCYLFLIFVFQSLSICLPPPLYRHIFCSYSYNCPVDSQVFKDIFLFFIGFLLSLTLEF